MLVVDSVACCESFQFVLQIRYIYKNFPSFVHDFRRLRDISSFRTLYWNCNHNVTMRNTKKEIKPLVNKMRPFDCVDMYYLSQSTTFVFVPRYTREENIIIIQHIHLCLHYSTINLSNGTPWHIVQCVYTILPLFRLYIVVHLNYMRNICRRTVGAEIRF